VNNKIPAQDYRQNAKNRSMRRFQTIKMFMSFGSVSLGKNPELFD